MSGPQGENIHETGLRKGVLGPFQIAFFVISAAGPLVAMAGGIPVSMLLGNGPGTPALFALTSVILILFAVGYTDMARDIRNAGAFYAFAARGIGPVAAGATGILALLSYNALQIGLYGLFGVACSALVSAFGGPELAWWACALTALILVALLGYRQVDLSARILGVLVALEYGVVLVLCLIMLAQGGAEGLSTRPFAPDIVASGAPAIGLLFCFAAFVGFEATTIYSEEARDPARSVPLATYMSVGLIGAFYSFGTWAVVMGTGVDQLWPTLQSLNDPTELLFELSRLYAGEWLTVAMRILFVTSTFASILAFHNAIARYGFAMGREGLLPRPLGTTHPRHRSPHIGSVVQSVLAFIVIAAFTLAGVDPVLVVFTLPSGIAVLGIVVLMACTGVAIIRYLRRHRPGSPSLIPSAIACIALFAVAGLAIVRFDVLLGTGGVLAMALPLCVPAALAIGAFLAVRLRTADPAAFAAIGSGAAN